ncbi:hypothetical protein [Priestia aryabhattai]|uniref:hypothetical protein n=1 Tax=Priestia aryabhattai TaxID=412384 RepID=UPI003D2A2CCD
MSTFTQEEKFRKEAHVWDGVPVQKQVKAVSIKEFVNVLGGNELKLLLSLVYEKDDDNCISLSVREIALVTGLSHMTVQKSLDKLLGTEYKGIPLLKKLSGEGRKRNVYRVADVKL